MNLKDALKCDFKDEEKVKEFKKFMSKVEWFKDKEVTQENMEKLMIAVRKKHKIRISYICPASELSYGFMIRNDENNAWIETIYAMSMFEGFAKSILVMYTFKVKGVKFKTGEK